MHGDSAENLAEQPGWVVRLVQRNRPDTGWGVFLLAFGAVILLPSALVEGKLLPGLDRTVLLSAISFVFAWWIAHRRISGLAAALLMGVTGVAADLWCGVFVLRPGMLASQLFRWCLWVLSDRREIEPAITYFREQWPMLGGYFQRVGEWLKGLIVGPGAPDNLAVIGLIILLTWLIAAWAAWWVARRGQTFVALLPTGMFLAQYAYWAPATLGYVLIFLGVTAFLLVLAHLVFNVRAWDEAGVDYAEGIRLDVLFAALALTLIVTFLSPTLPFFASGEFSQKFWKLFESPWRRVEQQVSASFQATQQVRSLVPPMGAAPGGLPRAHLLGGRPELGEEIALRVSVRGDPTGLQPYWRGQTYATYTGHGWENAAEGLIEESFDAGQPWQEDLPSVINRHPIVVSVKAVAASRSVLYAALEPIGVDRPYSAQMRAPDDLIALSSPRGAERYTVLSYVPKADSTVLRVAGSDYPSGVLSRYLQLPPDLDPRLPALAADWTRGALTPYDKAVAIERRLRAITYSLDVPLPPEDRDLVSWFLLDLQRGYCDYHASAMIVLSRLSGIPARLAIGYSTGDLDETSGEYVVTELNAHSWPELYYPGIGWMPFEPTSGLSSILRAAGEAPSALPSSIEQGPRDLATGMAELQEQARENAALEQRQAAGRGLRTIALALSTAWAAGLFVSSKRSIPQVAVPAVQQFDRLAAWGRRIGRPLSDGETPREYTGGLSQTATTIARRTRWRKRQAERAASVVCNEGSQLTEEMELSLFAPAGAATPVLGKRRELGAALRELWIAQSLSRLRKGTRS